MVYLFGIKSIESSQLRFWIEDAVCIMSLCESWTKRSMWEQQAWCCAKDTRGFFAGCLWPRGQSLLPELQCLPSTGCNSTTRAAAGTGTSNRVCPEALRAGKYMVSLGFSEFSWRRAGAFQAVMLVLPALAEVGPASAQSSLSALARPRMGTLSAMLGNMPRKSLCRLEKCSNIWS